MPFVLAFLAIVLIVAAIRNTLPQLGSQFSSDFTGFGKWAAAIIAIGFIGEIPGFKIISRMLLALVAVVIGLANGGGFFSQLGQAFQSPAAATPAGPATTPGQLIQTSPAPLSNAIAASGLSNLSLADNPNYIAPNIFGYNPVTGESGMGFGSPGELTVQQGQIGIGGVVPSSAASDPSGLGSSIDLTGGFL